MYILLKTEQVWLVRGEFTALRLFAALRVLLMSDDRIVIGSLNACDEAFEWLSEHSDSTSYRPFSESFNMNRAKFPNGRAFDLAAQFDIFSGLERFAKFAHGSRDKTLFFDHLVCYRRSTPIVPLINYHDAFNGGDLHLSGLYTFAELEAFSECVATQPTLIDNPEYRPDQLQR